MADISRHQAQQHEAQQHEAHSAHSATMSGHPDAAEMRQRYAKVLGGPRTTAADGLIVLAGLWLAISPWVLNFNNTAGSLSVVNLVLGLSVAAIGLACAIVPERIAGMGAALAAAGAFVIAVPWAIDLASTGHKIVWTNSVTGGVILLCGLATMLIARMARRKAAERH